MLVASPVLCDKDYSAQPSPLESKDKHFVVLLFAKIVLYDLSQVFFINRRFQFDLLSDQVVHPTQCLLLWYMHVSKE